MRLPVMVFFCLLACTGSAPAQSGISNQRDSYGNLVRDNGAASRGAINQGPANNGPIKNASPQPATGNVDLRRNPNR
jgi:hypothetical protein